MPVNFEKLNGNANGSKPAAPAPAPQHQPEQFNQQDLGHAEPQQPIAQIQTQVNAAIGGLKQAELAYAAQAFQRLGEQFEVDTDRISQTAEILLDPRVKVATGILKAADRINTRTEAGLELPFGGYSFEMPSIPGVPSFSQFYSQPRSEQPALPSSSGSTDSPIDASESEMISPGKQPTVAGKGFGTPRDRS